MKVKEKRAGKSKVALEISCEFCGKPISKTSVVERQMKLRKAWWHVKAFAMAFGALATLALFYVVVVIPMRLWQKISGHFRRRKAQ
jgi:hypothetical protein